MFPDLKTEPAVCPGCGQPCEAVRFGGVLRYQCDPCSDKAKTERRAAARRQDCLNLWRDITPPQFQLPLRRELLNPSLLPALDTDGLAGIGLVGDNGCGKTRIAFALMRRAALAGKKCYALTASAYRQAAADRHSHDCETAGRALERLRSAKHSAVLLIDDIGKGAKSESGDEAFYELLTHRRDHNLITHWTSNGSGKWIAERYGQDRGPAIAIRLAHLAGCHTTGQGRIFTAAKAPEIIPFPAAAA